MPNANTYPQPEPSLPQPTGDNSTYQNPRSLGESIVDSDSTIPQVTLLKGLLAGTGISITSLDDDLQINATGAGGVPDATETVKGILELATQAETNAGTDDERALTALKLRNTVLTATQIPTLDVSKISGVVPITQGGTGLITLGANDSYYLRTNAGATAMEWATVPTPTVPDASETVKGILEIATQGETDAGADDARALTALKLRNTTLTSAQIPSLDTAKITTGSFPIARGGTNLNSLGSALQYLSVNSAATNLEYINPTRGSFSRFAYVDVIRGNDSTAAISTTATDAILPFQTLPAAIAAANAISAGGSVVVYLGAGIYNITSNIVLNDNIAVVGIDASSVIINYAATTLLAIMFTMGNLCRLEQLTLNMTSSSPIFLTGILFPNTSTTSSKIRNVSLNVSSTAVDSKTVYGIHVNASTGIQPYFTNVRATTVLTNSTMTGPERAILVDGVGARFNCRDTILWTAGLGGNAIALETANATNVVYMCYSSMYGVNADISQTQGSINLSSSCLRNGNANGKVFSQCTNSGQLVFSDPGGIGTSTPRYYRFGTYAIGTTEVKLKFNAPTVVRNLRVNAISAASATRVYNWYVRKNGVSTTLTTQITGGATNAINNTTSVAFAVGDEISIMVEISGSGTPALTDTTVSVDLY